MENHNETVPSKPTDINNVPDINKSDYAIILNITIQFLIAIGGIILLLVIRRRLLWLYSPNTKNKKNHPAYKRTDSYFSWLIPIITISDVNLVSIIGLDSFMMLQTYKMFYRMLFTISLVSIPLYYCYYTGSTPSKEDQLFLKFSMMNLSKAKKFYIPAAYCYVITFLIFYLLYVYYKKFISLRQAFIRSPAVFSPLSNLKKLSFIHENYLDEMNLPSKSVLMTRVPPFINTDTDFRIFIEALGCGIVERCVIVEDTRTLERLAEERDMIVRDVEREIERMYRGIIEEIKVRSETDDNMKKLLAELQEIDIQTLPKRLIPENQNTELKEKIRELLEVEKPLDEITEIAKKLLFSKNKYIKSYKKMDALTYKMNKLTIVQKEISEEIRKINDCPKNDRPEEEIIDMMNTNDYMFTRIDIDRDVPFFSIGQIIHLRKNAHLFTLDLPAFTKTGFVTFTEMKSAQLLAQCLISSKVFSCKALPAPSPSDVIWENLNRGEIITYFKSLVGSIIFIVLNFVFYTLVFGLSGLIRLEQLEKAFPILKNFTTAPWLRNSFNGIVTPLIFNALLSTAPFILTIITYYEGIYSYSSLYRRLMERYAFFLLFNGFLALLLSSTFYGKILEIFRGTLDLSNFAQDFAKNLTELSVFFTNAIIQKMILGNVIVILKPVKLFIEWFSDGICLFFGSIRSRRSVTEAHAPESANFGVIYPNTLLIFPMALAYAVISPTIIIFAALYFFCTYLVYKQEFIYSLGNEFETGGIYWEQVTKQIITAVFIFQIATMCQLIAPKKHLEILIIFPVTVLTYMYKNALESMFSNSIKYYPLNEQEEIYTDRFTTRVIEKRKIAVENWDEVLDPNDPDIIPCDELVLKANKIRKIDYSYKGSVSGLESVMFPKHFFKKIECIISSDPDDKLKIFKEAKRQ